MKTAIESISCNNVNKNVQEIVDKFKQIFFYQELVYSKADWMIFGGAARDILHFKQPRDYDVIVDNRYMDYKLFDNNKISNGSNLRKCYENGKFEVWHLSDHIVPCHTLKEVVSTTNLDVNQVGIIMNGDKIKDIVYSKKFNQSVVLSTVSKTENDPYQGNVIKLCARAYLISKKLDYKLSNELFSEIKQILKDDNKCTMFLTYVKKRCGVLFSGKSLLNIRSKVIEDLLYMS